MRTDGDPLKPILRKDPRYTREAYHFIFEALAYTQKTLGLAEAETEAERHVTGRQLLQGARDLALEQFGPMAVAVFRAWGVHRTVDFGQIVFNLVENSLMSKTETDTLDDFTDVYDFEEVFLRGYRISIDTDSI